VNEPQSLPESGGARTPGQAHAHRSGESRILILAAEAAAQAARKLAEAVIETVREPLLVLSKDLKIVRANRSFYAQFGVRPENTIGQSLFNLGNGQWDIPGLRRLLSEIVSCDSHFDDYLVDFELQKIGRRVMLLNARRVTGGDLAEDHILLAIEDVTERKRLEAELIAATVTDPLTGLLNRRGLLSRLEEIRARAHEARTPFTLLLLDLDGLKSINDKLGHEEGDRALTDLASILRSTFSGSEAVARFGGDEFVVVSAGVSRSEGERAIARLQEALAAHNQPRGQSYRLSVGSGLSCYNPLVDTPVRQLLAEGDAAMYGTKRRRRTDQLP